MNIVKDYPPNIDLIRAALSVTSGALFCYGDTLYNPSGRDILPDVELHESVHSRQQAGDPETWWYNYLTDPAFRLEQEIEAYGEQYAFAKKHIEEASDQAASEGKRIAAGKHKLLRWALENMARALSGEAYGNLLSYAEAESRIKRYTPAA